MANQYFLYKTRQPSTPFMIINPDTINDSSTSLTFIGQTLTNYGQIEQQDQLSLLENFANNSAPAPAVLGQEWFNTADNQMYHCVNETGNVFQKINKPIISATAPTAGILTTGDLWSNTTDGRLYMLATDNITWIAVGPITQVPITVSQNYYFNVVTANNSTVEMWLNGISGNRLIIPINTSWLFKIDLIGRVEESVSEIIGLSFSGILDRPNSGATNILGGIANTVYGITNTLTGVTASVSADVSNNALGIYVTGQSGKTIKWNAVCSITICTN